MSRISINRRIERLKNHLIPPGSIEARLEKLSQAECALFSVWRGNCHAIFSRHENSPGAAYAAMIEGELMLPELPRWLRYAVWPELERIEAEPIPARAYQMMLEGN